MSSNCVSFFVFLITYHFFLTDRLALCQKKYAPGVTEYGKVINLTKRQIWDNLYLVLVCFGLFSDYFTILFPDRLAWRQKKYAIAGTEYDKVIDLTKRRFGDDAIELIDVYQESGRVSFVQYWCWDGPW